MRVRPGYRMAIRSAARWVGMEEVLLRRVYERIEPSARRDRIDNEHLRLLIALCLPENANCIDAGAHSGVHLREMVRCAPRGRHIAYEPIPEFAARLRSAFPTVDVRNAALWDQAGEETFFYVAGDPMQSALKLRTDADPQLATQISVRLERLDEALPEGYVPDLIKIDVEGAERQVIEGALETISRHVPIVCFEHGPGAEVEYGTRPEQVYELLVRQAGLRIFDIDGNGPYSETQFVDVFHKPIWNFVAHR